MLAEHHLQCAARAPGCRLSRLLESEVFGTLGGISDTFRNRARGPIPSCRLLHPESGRSGRGRRRSAREKSARLQPRVSRQRGKPGIRAPLPAICRRDVERVEIRLLRFCHRTLVRDGCERRRDWVALVPFGPVQASGTGTPEKSASMHEPAPEDRAGPALACSGARRELDTRAGSGEESEFASSGPATLP